MFYFLRKARFHHLLTIIDCPQNAAPRFRTTKTVISEGGGRLLTLRGPLINSQILKRGAAYEPRSIHIYIYIYIYACCGVTICAKFGLLRCYYLGQVCFLQNTVCQKHYKNRGCGTFFFEEKLRVQI